MNALRKVEALHGFLVEQAAALLDARRVLLVLDGGDGRGRVAGAHLPPGEQADALLDAITPWLAEAKRTRRTRLRHGPEGAEPIDQRSCLVAPLAMGGGLLGTLYADIEGPFGRFGESDRDLLAMLARQGAVALGNASLTEGLESQVAEGRAALEQRAGELAVIDSIQQGMAAELDFQAIVDLVGDTLREVFKTGDLGIHWGDEASQQIRFPYQYERGVRLYPKPIRPSTGTTRSWSS